MNYKKEIRKLKQIIKNQKEEIRLLAEWGEGNKDISCEFQRKYYLLLGKIEKIAQKSTTPSKRKKAKGKAGHNYRNPK